MLSPKNLIKIVITLSKLGTPWTFLLPFLVYCNLKIINPVPSHGLTVHQVSIQFDENCRRSLTEISEQSLKSNDHQILVYCKPVTSKQYALYHFIV